MLILQRITSEYIASEDRFLFSGRTDKGVEVSYWITQRLLLRLLSFVLDWLEAHREELERQAAKNLMAPMLPKSAAEHEAEAEAAKSDGEADSTAAGKSGKEDAAELLRAADIRVSTDRFTLVFKPRRGENAQLSLQLLEAWQWIAILQTLWKRAEWDESVWPDWIEEVKAPHPGKSWGAVH